MRRAAQEAGLHEFAVADALRAAREMIDLGDHGTLKAKDGKTKVAEWFAGAKDTSPHWFPATGSGSGSTQSLRSRGEANTLTRRQFERLSPAQRAAIARSGDATIIG